MIIAKRLVVAVSFLVFLLLYSFHIVEGDITAAGKYRHNDYQSRIYSERMDTKIAGSSASIE
jgi:hypothetical protein